MVILLPCSPDYLQHLYYRCKYQQIYQSLTYHPRTGKRELWIYLRSHSRLVPVLKEPDGFKINVTPIGYRVEEVKDQLKHLAVCIGQLVRASATDLFFQIDTTLFRYFYRARFRAFIHIDVGHQYYKGWLSSL